MIAIKTENLSDIEDLETAKRVHEIAEYYFDFSHYFGKVLELVVQYTKNISQENPTNWIVEQICKYPYRGMAEFINQYISKQKKMFNKTDGFYILLDDKVCCMSLTSYRTNDLVNRAGNTYHLMLGCYYDNDCAEEIIDIYEQLVKNFKETAEGLYALKRLTEEIIEDRKAQLN